MRNSEEKAGSGASPIPADRRALEKQMLELRLRQRGISTLGTQTIPRRKDAGPCPLSFAQERLWFLDRWNEGSAWYNIPLALRFSGPLAVSTLERCLRALVQRHEILRTTFEERSGRPVQVIAPCEVNEADPEQGSALSAPTIRIPVIDLRGWGGLEGDRQVRGLLRAEVGRSFDLAKGPLLRVYLLKIDKQEHILLCMLHHIITDAWSTGVLVREMTTLYQAELNREYSEQEPRTAPVATPQGPTLPELPIQYADYALWQRQQLQDGVLDWQLAYWREQLAGMSPLELPTDHPRPRIKTDRGASQSRLLPQALSEAVSRLCQRQDVTLFMLLLSTFQVLLMRYTGTTDISVGTMIANRTRAELEGMIGFFVNTLVMRTDLGGNPTFVDLLRRVREVCLRAYVHQDIPVEKVIEELVPVRDVSHSPLFQVMLILQNTPREGRNIPVQDLAGVRVTPLEIESTTSKVDLALSLTETAQGLACVLEYSTDLFEAPTIARMLAHFQTLLEGIVQDPQARLADLPLLTEAERAQVLSQGRGPREWHATGSDYPQDRCVHQLMEQQVQQNPDAVALVFEEQTLTYAHLDSLANQLAYHLQALGVAPERSVGISMQRSIEMAIAMLAVLKAGGVVVPIDPATPKERLAYVLTDAQISILLTQHQIQEPWKDILATVPIPQAKTVVMERDWPVITLGPCTQPESQVQLENLCYVIYTSGSTGTPKGVAVPHRVLVNLLTWHQSHLLGGVRTLQFASLAFDASFHEFFATWCTGGMLFLVAEPMRADMGALARLLQERAIEKMILPVVVLHHVMEQSSLERRAQRLHQASSEYEDWTNSLKEITATGEQLLISQAVATVFEELENVSLHNHYGPSETHVVTAYTLLGSASKWPTYPPIGQPIASTDCYILDEYGQPVPQGMVGELYIGGVSLARGYVGRADLTAERFVPRPFAGTEKRVVPELPSEKGINVSALEAYSWGGERLYKTGDLVRYLADGNIEYLGRRDTQVKIRGHRVELGEIEAILLRHPLIRDVACELVSLVLTDENAGNEKRLTAYIVGSQELTPVILREYLQDKLPPYMIPVFFVLLEALPLTTNGKVDRKALLLIDPIEQTQRLRKQNETLMALSREASLGTTLQELLGQVWKEVLHLSQVDIHDNFFELGGHSLLAMQLLSRIRTVLAVEVPLRDVFEKPTIAGLAKRVEQILRQGQGMSMPPLVAMARPEAIPLSFGQQGLWFLDQLEPGSTVFLLSSAYRLLGEALNLQYLDQSLQELIQRHESLRTTFVGGRSAQGAGQGSVLFAPTTLIPLDQPVQVIHPYAISGSRLLVIDLQGLWPQHREEQSHELARQEARNPCDLAKGPLLRVALLRLGRHEQVLLLSLHHIVTDGWSNQVLVHELIQLYLANVSGQPSPLAPLSIQFADYALWQRQWLQGKVLAVQMAYWRKQLADLSPLTLPTDYPRPAVRSSHGASQSVQISQEVLEGLSCLCRQENVTLFITLLAAFKVLLARYCSQDDIAVGTSIANRNLTEIEGLIGFFVNTLVLRTALGGNPTFVQVLQRVREVCLGAYAHPDIPFKKVVEELAPLRDPSYTPLFQVMFNLQNAPAEERQEQGNPFPTSTPTVSAQDQTGISIEPLAMEKSTSQFDLILSAFETETAPGGLTCILEYSTDLFEAPTITRWLTSFQTLLEGVMENPQAHISDLPLLTPSEQAQLLVQWNATQVEYPEKVCLHQLFEQQVERTADSIALAFGEDKQLTYQELNACANQLRSHLQEMGIEPEVLVGVCIERSLELVISLLAVLKAGGAYVPLDPEWPQERLSSLVEAAQVPLVLTQAHLLDSLSLPAKVKLLTLPSGSSIEALGTGRGSYPAPSHLEKRDHLAGPVQPDNLAYVMYTSGSTGQPKGVQISHASVVHSTLARFSYYRESVRHYLLLSPFFFDSSVAGLYWTLCQGGRLVLPAGDLSQALDRLPSFIAQQYISHLLSTPSLYTLLLAEGQEQHLSSLCTVIVAGENCPVGLVERHRAVLPQATLFNEYGPTEATVWSSVYRDQGQPLGSFVPIGRPITNVQIYLLQQAMYPVPIGVPAELCIGGLGVARGYLDQADLTAERFVPCPISSQPGERIYRTGDLARYLPDGTLEFLGRMDQQVKLRGFRIELGEIEATLQAHPAVQEAVVILREEERDWHEEQDRYKALSLSTRKYLVAYVTPAAAPLESQAGISLSQAHKLTAEQLQQYLREQLPDYMVPARIFLLDHLPLTSNEKVDRRALAQSTAPAVTPQGPTEPGTALLLDGENPFVSPRTPLEDRLVDIWSGMLGRQRVSICDSFFQLGGDSLQAVQLTSRISATLNADISVKHIFMYPTIAALADALADLLPDDENVENGTQGVYRES